jgi:hypothetical protein
MSLRFRDVSDERTGDKGHHAPQSAYDASEAAEQHRRCDVNRLIRSVLISLCCLAGAKIRKCRLGQAEPHNILNRELSIVQHDCTVQGLRVLYGMTGQMKNMRWCLLEQWQ